jgi:predicted transcriptional regulator
MANILQVADGGAKKTHIMYQCNLSFRQLNAYLEFLAEMGFLENKILKPENKDNSQLFKATPKGKDFINAYHNLRALLVT